jgi:hypothetical protein
LTTSVISDILKSEARMRKESFSMEQNMRAVADRPTSDFSYESGKSEPHSSGVSWAAVIGGAFTGAALSLILLALGTGLGLSSVSPWSNTGASAPTIGKAAIAWLVFTQIVASAMAGYLAGRLRTKWATIHTDEVYFRDTANGFLAWAVGIVMTAAFLAAAAASMIGGTAQPAPPSGAAATGKTVQAEANDYFVDALFRSDRPSERSDVAGREEAAARILAHGLKQDDVSAADRSYLTQLVAARTGLSKPEAEQRVNEVITEARQTADTARKALAHLSLWMFIALLSGAFCASYAATIGGRQRDHVKSV